MQKAIIILAVVALLATVAYAGPFDKITEGVKDATSKVTGAVDGAVNGTKTAVNTVTNGTKTAATAVGNTGKDAVKAVGDGGKAVGDAIKPKSAAGMASAKGVVAAAGFGSLLLLGMAL